MILTDGVITLRRHTMNDVDAIAEQCTDEDSLRWTTVPRGYTTADAAAFVEHIAAEWAAPHGVRFWAIEVVGDDGTPRFGGTIELRPGESWDYASIGFGLHPAARGRGVMARAVRLMAAWAFEHGPWGRPLARIHWRAIAGNWGSRRVAWATGFTFHGMLPGTHRNVLDPHGPGLDSWHASIAAGDLMEPRHPWFEPVVVEGEKVRLRPWRASDAPSVEPSADPQHWLPQHVLLTPENFSSWVERRRELMATGHAIEWAIADAETDRALGQMTVFQRGGPLTGDVAEVGYQLFPSARGHGYVKAACLLAVGHAFRPKEQGGLGLRRLVAETAADNEASNGVLRSAGFVAYGREHATDELPDGSYEDGLHWELLR